MDNFNEFQKGTAFGAMRDFCESHGSIVKYSKGDVFVEQGKVLKYWGVVAKGHFAYTVLDSLDNEKMIGFALPGGIVGSYSSVINGTPSEANIIALSDAEVVRCSVDDFENLLRKNDYEWMFGIANSLYLDIHSRYTDIYRKTPKERYQALLAKCPEILQHITLGQLASYLMISQTHLSRIRKEISSEDYTEAQ